MNNETTGKTNNNNLSLDNKEIKDTKIKNDVLKDNKDKNDSDVNKDKSKKNKNGSVGEDKEGKKDTDYSCNIF